MYRQIRGNLFRNMAVAHVGCSLANSGWRGDGLALAGAQPGLPRAVGTLPFAHAGGSRQRGNTRRVTHARIRRPDRSSQLHFFQWATRDAPHREAGGTTVAMTITRRRSGLGGPLTGSVARSWTARHPHIDVVPEVERGVLCWGRALRSRGRGVVKPRRRRGAPPSTYGRRTETNRALTTRGSGRSARPFCVDPRSPLGYALALEVGVMIRSAGWLHAPRGTRARVRLEAP
jgi:hypothetical protein